MNFGQSLKSLFDPSKWSNKAFIQNEVSKGYEFNQVLDAQMYPMMNGGAPTGDAGSFFDSISSSQSFSYSSITDAIIAYERCPPVTAIVNKKAQAFNNGKLWVLNKDGANKGKEATTPEALKIKTLLSKPNPVQSGKQFEAQNYIYTQLCGYSLVLVVKPFGFKNIRDAYALWNLPPQFLEVNEKKFKPLSITKLSDILDSVFLVFDGEKTELNVDDLIIIRDFVPSFGSPFLPESRIRSVAMPINNIIGAYESRNVLINHRGPGYFISNGGKDQIGVVPMPEGEKLAIQQQFARRYGLRKGQSRAIITEAAASISPIGYPTKDLLLFEEIEGSTMAICDNHGYPYRLMAAEKAASYNDVSEFKKMLYQDTIIPEGESVYEQWDAALKLSDLGLELNKDFSHIPALQADAQAMAIARKARNEALEREYRYDNITLNRWRELNGEDPADGGDVYFSEWLKAGNNDPYARNAGSAAPAQDGEQINQSNGTANTGSATANDQ